MKITIRQTALCCFLSIAVGCAAAAESPASAQPSGDWFSEQTLASVVKLGSVVTEYVLDGLPDDYSYSTKNGKPDFGTATLVEEKMEFVHVGTGVVVTPDGLILSNAHVTEAYNDPSPENYLGPDDKPLKGKSGRPLKIVIVNVLPRYMFVGASTVANIDSGNEKQTLSYLARVLFDDPGYNQNRDRAVLKIEGYASLDDDGLPAIGNDVSEDFSIPYCKMENPFKISYLDNRVRAIGYPGAGDPDRASKTSGELLGYENSKKSVILHTSWISNGNSGGGLFYKDHLIGINTWDNRANPARPVAMSQPITYWGECFTQLSWYAPLLKLPDFSYDWILSDPSTESYKNMTEAAFVLVSASDKRTPVTNGRLYAYRESASIDDVQTYIQYEKIFDLYWKVAYYLWIYSPEEVEKAFDVSEDTVNNLKGIRTLDDFRRTLKKDVVPYFDIWAGNDFFYTSDYPASDSGKAMVYIPRNSTVNIVYADSDGNVQDSFTLKTGADFAQGPYTLPVKK